MRPGEISDGRVIDAYTAGVLRGKPHHIKVVQAGGIAPNNFGLLLRGHASQYLR
jgi:hypothetical protein